MTVNDLLSQLQERLLSPDELVRGPAVELVSGLLERQLARGAASALDSGALETLSYFFSAHLPDFACLGEVLRGLAAFVQFPALTAGAALRAFDALSREVVDQGFVQALPQAARFAVMRALSALLSRHAAALRSERRAHALVLAFARTLDTEKDPRNLVQALGLYPAVCALPEHEQFAEELFEVCAVYFPVTYRARAGDSVSPHLLESLLDAALSASPHFVPFSAPFLAQRLPEAPEAAVRALAALAAGQPSARWGRVRLDAARALCVRGVAGAAALLREREGNAEPRDAALALLAEAASTLSAPPQIADGAQNAAAAAAARQVREVAEAGYHQEARRALPLLLAAASAAPGPMAPHVASLLPILLAEGEEHEPPTAEKGGKGEKGEKGENGGNEEFPPERLWACVRASPAAWPAFVAAVADPAPFAEALWREGDAAVAAALLRRGAAPPLPLLCAEAERRARDGRAGDALAVLARVPQMAEWAAERFAVVNPHVEAEANADVRWVVNPAPEGAFHPLVMFGLAMLAARARGKAWAAREAQRWRGSAWGGGAGAGEAEAEAEAAAASWTALGAAARCSWLPGVRARRLAAAHAESLLSFLQERSEPDDEDEDTEMLWVELALLCRVGGGSDGVRRALVALLRRRRRSDGALLDPQWDALTPGLARRQRLWRQRLFEEALAAAAADADVGVAPVLARLRPHAPPAAARQALHCHLPDLVRALAVPHAGDAARKLLLEAARTPEDRPEVLRYAAEAVPKLLDAGAAGLPLLREMAAADFQIVYPLKKRVLKSLEEKKESESKKIRQEAAQCSLKWHLLGSIH